MEYGEECETIENFNMFYAQTQQESIIPNSSLQDITHLTIDGRFSDLLSMLPPSLTHLTLSKFLFKHDFKPQIHYLPPSLTHLRILNSTISVCVELPPHLEHIEIQGNSVCDFKDDIMQLPLKHLFIATRSFFEYGKHPTITG